MNTPPDILRFRRIGTVTIFAVYFLILVGGIVRASGAGMGCPDWPTCFGQWIPPTQESQLPADYHQIYADLGYADTRFNPVKTWTEYSNRLVGVSIGFLIILTVIYSVPFLKRDKVIFYLSAMVLLLVGFQGWLGSAVVKSNLHPVMITAHMLLALAIVALLIYAISRSQRSALEMLECRGLPTGYRRVLLAAMGLTLIQVTMGTQVREAVDLIAQAHAYENRQLWRQEFPLIFYVHRSFSAIVLFSNLWLVWKLLQGTAPTAPLRRPAIALIVLVGCAILTGVTMDRLGIPAVAQPLHLLLATLIFGTQFFLYIAISFAMAKQQGAPNATATP